MTGTVRCTTFAVALMVVLAATGACQKQNPGGAGRGEGAGDVRPDGHVYVAQLAALHPLYADLAEIDRAVRRLRAPEMPLEFSWATAPDLGGEYFAGPTTLADLAETWAARRDTLTRALARRPTRDPGLLAPDLAARLRWKQAQAQRQAESALARARGQSSEEVADRAIALFLANQERLTSLGERLGGEGDKPDEVLAELEAELAALRRQHQARLADLELSLLASTDAKVAEAQRSVRREAATRQRPPGRGAGEELTERVLAELEPFEAAGWSASARLRMPDVQLPDGFEDPAAARADAEMQRQQLRVRLADVLARRQAQITRRILAASRLSAERIARRRGIRLQYSPVGDAVGPDLTEEIAEAIRATDPGANRR